MEVKTILYEVQDGVAMVTLNRPEVLNAVNGVMGQELHQVLAQIAGEQGVRAVLLTGAGRAFCAGADLAQPGEGVDVEDADSILDTQS